MEVVVQALKIVDDLRIDRAIFEGDANNVILTLQGMSEYAD